jgi:hypothetical protein
MSLKNSFKRKNSNMNKSLKVTIWMKLYKNLWKRFLLIPNKSRLHKGYKLKKITFSHRLNRLKKDKACSKTLKIKLSLLMKKKLLNQSEMTI